MKEIFLDTLSDEHIFGDYMSIYLSLPLIFLRRQKLQLKKIFFEIFVTKQKLFCLNYREGKYNAHFLFMESTQTA